MSEAALDPTTGLDEASAPPRANGELVFTAPWQSRLFATTMALRERDLLDWEAFRQSLIAHIATHTDALADPALYDYWGCWQRALEERLVAGELVGEGALGARAQDFAARPAGHDHSHGHSHDDHDHDHSHGDHQH
ncbi:MAG: nitrile hydratase accessory protein [Actinomycetota bacterium]